MIALTAPEAGVHVTSGGQTRITWERTESGPDLPYVVTIEFSPDNGASWERVTASVPLEDYTYTWTVPFVESDSCLLRIMSGKNYSLLASSDGVFSIVAGDVIVEGTSPASFALYQNNPNPFNPVTAIPFSLGEESRVTLSVYSITGEKVAILVNDILPAGNHRLTWDATGYASGVYVCRLTAGELVTSRKMLLVK